MPGSGGPRGPRTAGQQAFGANHQEVCCQNSGRSRFPSAMGRACHHSLNQLHTCRLCSSPPAAHLSTGTSGASPQAVLPTTCEETGDHPRTPSHSPDRPSPGPGPVPRRRCSPPEPAHSRKFAEGLNGEPEGLSEGAGVRAQLLPSGRTPGLSSATPARHGTCGGPGPEEPPGGAVRSPARGWASGRICGALLPPRGGYGEGSTPAWAAKGEAQQWWRWDIRRWGPCSGSRRASSRLFWMPERLCPTSAPFSK